MQPQNQPQNEDTGLGQFLIVILLFAVGIGGAFLLAAGMGGTP
jgi:hypothetical protein